MEAVRIASGSETLEGRLHGALPAPRAAILVHGQSWDADRWDPAAAAIVARGVPALALNLRGHGGSTGAVEPYAPGKAWSPVVDLRAARAFLRQRGAAEIALVGASLGGHAVLGASLDGDCECVVSISAPVTPVPDELSRRVSGRALYLCASDDAAGATPNVLASFVALREPKTLVLFGGREHSIAMLRAPYGDECLEAIVDFVTRGL
ncbi:MAG: alpha/beta hydrolase [Candidatus Limnocylindria bacterium]